MTRELTVYDVRREWRLVGECYTCRRGRQIDLGRLGDHLVLSDLYLRLRCTNCGARVQRMVLVYKRPAPARFAEQQASPDQRERLGKRRH